MKKFSKILILLLTVIVITTAFTVTILATEETPEANKEHGTQDISGSWEDAEPGAYVSNGHIADRLGYMYAELGQDGENKYLASTPSPNKGKLKADGVSLATDTWMVDISLPRPTKAITVEGEDARTYQYNLKDYPYTVMDFDICSPSGTYGSGNLFDFNFRIGSMGGNTGNFVLKYNFTDFKVFLDQTPYKWQHVTAVSKLITTLSEFDGTIATANYVTDIYVDGVYKTTVEQSITSTLYIGKDPEHIGYYQIRMNNNVTSGTSLIDGYDWSTYNAKDVTTWPGYDEATGTYTDPAFWYKEKAAMDNAAIHYYQSGWTSADIAADLYDAETYEFPFGLATATVNDVLYDNIDKAIAAAVAEGATVQLLTDITDTVSIETPVAIDTNKYDAEGVATGAYYDIAYTSQTLKPVIEGGIITFKDAGDEKVKIYWDYCETCDCDDPANHGEDCTCTCDVDVPGHIMYAESTAVLGTTPYYPGEIPTIEIENGMVEFVGWSRTLGGEAEEIVITEDDLDATEINLYPVYVVTIYTFEVTTKAGVVTYHTADEFATLFSTAANGSTIKLLRDLDVNVGRITLSGKTLTLDLNGYDIRRTSYYGTTYRYANGDTTDEVVSTTTGNGNLFYAADGTVNFTITSGAPGSDFYLHYMKRDSWIDDAGNEVKFATSTPSVTTLMVPYTTTNFTLSNVSVYATSFFADAHASLKLNITITNCNLYRTEVKGGTGVPAFYLATKTNNAGTVLVEDTFIYSNVGSYFIRQDGGTTAGCGVKVTFTNCDFYAESKGHNQLKHGSEMQVYENCRYWGAYFNSTYAGTFGVGTLFTVKSSSDYDKIVAALPDGYSIKNVEETKTYTIPTVLTSPIDENGYATFNFAMTEETATYTYKVQQAVEVKWMNGDALVDTTYVVVGETAVGPEITYVIEDDLYRNGKYLWVDAEGNADLTIASADTEYVFYATETVNGERGYVAGMKDARISLVYYSQFHMNFYIPVVEEMDAAPIVNNKTLSSKVFIDDEEFWVYTDYCSTATMFDDVSRTVKYTIDGVAYSQKFTYSGLVYAQQVLNNPGYTAEHESVANMVRYVREAIEVYVLTKPDINTYTSEIEALIGTANEDGSTTGGLYSLPAYTTEYPDVEENDYSVLYDYVESITYGMYGSTPRLMVKFKEAAKTENVDCTFWINGVNPGTYPVTDNGVVKFDENMMRYTYNAKVYDIVHPVTIVLTVPGVDGAEPTVISATYSIGAYLEANPDVEIVEALYAFGVAAESYKKSVS